VSDLTLVPIVRTLNPVTTAVLYAREARAYLRMSAAKFHRMVADGKLRRRVHIDGKRPFFLKHELDAYLASTPEWKGENPQAAEEEE
jgi:predicted DNA-binding transcriptional regulator AlpA